MPQRRVLVWWLCTSDLRFYPSSYFAELRCRCRNSSTVSRRGYLGKKCSTWIVEIWWDSVSDDDEAVEAQSKSDAGLVVFIGKHCWQPPCFSWVEQQEKHVMALDEFFQQLYVFKCLHDLLLCGHVMTRHWNLKSITLSIDLRIYLSQFFSRSLGLWLTTLYRVFIFVESLPHRIWVAHLRIIYKWDVFYTPADEIPSQLAAQSACSKKKALGLLYFGYIECGK